MPTYVYECASCAKQFEAEQRIVEPPLTTCVACGTEGTVKRIIQPIAVMFKGSGFHINDYASSGAGGGASPATPPTPAVETPTPAAPAAAPASDATSTE